MPKAIFFDAVGTLIYLPRSVGEHYRDVAERHGAELNAEALNSAFKAAWKTSPPRGASNGPRPDDDRGWWRDLVTRVLAETLPQQAAQGFDAAAYFDDLYEHFAKPGVWAAFPEVRDALSALREREYRLGVISNFDRRLRAVLRDLELLPFFQNVTISSELGCEKPDPRIFRAALDALSANPESALHVGDDEADAGAQAVGMRFFHLRRPEKDLKGVLSEAERL